MSLKRIAILTSGGDAPGMNAAVRALTKIAASRSVEVHGVVLGYDGLIDGEYRPLTENHGVVDGKSDFRPVPSVDRAAGRGGTVLGSARSKRFRTPEGRAEAAAKLKALDVDGLVVIGGNGSLTGAHLLAKEHGIKVVGLPASIDNDIGATTTCIGVDTAVNTIIDACDRISDTASAHRRAFIVEVMGRECGYLAMASAIGAGADAVLFREQKRTEEEVIQAVEDTIRKGFARGKQRVLIIKSEGVPFPGTRLAREVNERIDGDIVRATILGHLVRGGRPSFQDRRVAARMSFAALGALTDGRDDTMAAWRSSSPDAMSTLDPAVSLVPLKAVLTETDALLKGESPIMKWRLAMMEQVAGVLGV
jgi:6-phosphofructokinase 1